MTPAGMTQSTPPRRQTPSSAAPIACVVASLAASTCCVLPLVLVLVGIGGAWMTNLAALKPLTPAFVAVTLGALGWAAYLLFGRKAQCEDLNGVCETTRPVARRVFAACAIFISLLLLFPLAAPLFY
jgi:mercuric ion transport protein